MDVKWLMTGITKLILQFWRYSSVLWTYASAHRHGILIVLHLGSTIAICISSSWLEWKRRDSTFLLDSLDSFMERPHVLNCVFTRCVIVSPYPSECRSWDCEHCFSRDFCTKCKPGFQLHKGKCLSRCPEGTIAHQTDCLGKRHANRTRICHLKVGSDYLNGYQVMAVIDP